MMKSDLIRHPAVTSGSAVHTDTLENTYTNQFLSQTPRAAGLGPVTDTDVTERRFSG